MARMKKVEGMLEVLTGRANAPKVYGKQGAYESIGEPHDSKLQCE